jgi:hypothetical protein
LEFTEPKSSFGRTNTNHSADQRHVRDDHAYRSASQDPTAVQAVLDMHDTPLRVLLVVPVGLGVVWIDQLVPFQPSANVTSGPDPMLDHPTAVQAVLDVHDTELRLLYSTGGGVVWIDQLVPFHRSANDVPFPSPTAVQAVLDVHDTPMRLNVAPVGLGVVWIDQLVPFQRSANVT